MPSAGEESSLTPEQKKQAEKVENDIEQLRRKIGATWPHTFPEEVERLDEFMGFIA